MRLPAALLGHRMHVEPYLGADATGPIYGPAVQVRCLVEQRTRSVRTPTGRQVVASSVIRCQVDEPVTAESRITYAGRVVEVLGVATFDGGGLSTPDHLEITVQ